VISYETKNPSGCAMTMQSKHKINKDPKRQYSYTDAQFDEIIAMCLIFKYSVHLF